MPRLAWPLSWSLLVGLIACGDADTPNVRDARDPVPYLPELDQQSAMPSLAPDEVADAIERRFADMIVAVPTGFPAAFEAMMALAEPGCPERAAESEGTRTVIRFYTDGCQTAGAAFYGGIEYVHEAGTIDDEGSEVDSMEFFANGLRIEQGDRRFLEADGYFSFRRTRNVGFSSGSSFSNGRLAADPETAGTDPWMTGQVEGQVGLFVGDYSGYRIASVDATVASDDPEVVAISMQELRWEPGQCDVELMGSGSVREVNGVWHDVIFATRLEDSEEVLDCDGCGDHLAAGAPQDEPVCHVSELDTLVDFSGGLPW